MDTCQWRQSAEGRHVGHKIYLRVAVGCSPIHFQGFLTCDICTSFYLVRLFQSRHQGPEASQLCAEAVNTDVPLNAKFHSSNALLNKIVTIWQQSQLDNMHGCIASDCPHRERSPYTGDGQIACDMVMSNFDAAAFYQKWIRDIRDVQNILTGYVPNGAPWQPVWHGELP